MLRFFLKQKARSTGEQAFVFEEQLLKCHAPFYQNKNEKPV
jgi:hypothetical protein